MKLWNPQLLSPLRTPVHHNMLVSTDSLNSCQSKKEEMGVVLDEPKRRTNEGGGVFRSDTGL